MLQAIQQLDERGLAWIAEHLRVPLLNAPMVWYTLAGNVGLLFIACTVVLLLVRATRKTGLACAASMVLNLAVVNAVIKPLVSRERPWIVMNGLETLLRDRDLNSFPSGHTSAAFAFALAVCLTAPKKWMKAAALIAAALMGFSRLYVSVHFPSDVLAGALIGAACGVVGTLLTKKLLSSVQHRQGQE